MPRIKEERRILRDSKFDRERAIAFDSF